MSLDLDKPSERLSRKRERPTEPRLPRLLPDVRLRSPPSRLPSSREDFRREKI